MGFKTFEGERENWRDLDYALSILKNQGYNINQDDKSLTATSVTSAEPATLNGSAPSTSLKSPEPTPALKTPEPAPSGPMSQEMEEEGVISADCRRLTE